MTEMEEIKTMLVDMNKKLDKVIFQNKIALNTKYGSPIKQEIEESCCKKFREVKHEAVKEFAEKLKEKALSHCRTINCYERKFIIETINELVKEYEKWTEVKDAYQIGQLNESKKV